jgi:PAS domain S-box-containing protein/diguanylate cyclase (GGDEF)-like protein
MLGHSCQMARRMMRRALLRYLFGGEARRDQPPSRGFCNRMKPLFASQLIDATRHDGSLDLEMIAHLVSTAYADADRELSRQTSRFQAVINGMAQGLCFFDSTQRLVVCNRHYIDIYGLNPDLVRPGVTIREIFEQRYAAGSVPNMSLANYLRSQEEVISAGQPHDSTLTLRSGQLIVVCFRPMPDGSWVSTHEDVTDRHRIEHEVWYLTNHDSLTGLPNQALFGKLLEQAIAKASAGNAVAMLSVILDNFGRVNSVWGPMTAGELVRQVADRLRHYTPIDGFLARPSTNQFAIVQTAMGDPAGATGMAVEVLQAMKRPFLAYGQEIRLGATIGIEVATDPGLDPNVMIKNADMAMYHAQTLEKGSFRYFEAAMDVASEAQTALEADLREAVAAMAFELHYQPQIDLPSRRVSGFEALIRWFHPVRGNVTPAAFIPLAEELGLIELIGEWVLNRSCLDAASWPEEIGVAVNISALQLKGKGLTEVVMAAIANAGLSPSRLELEITESIVIDSIVQTLNIFSDLRMRGVRIAVDDFGVGYSSLAYLASLPFDRIKTDRSFVCGLGQNDRLATIVHAIIDLSASLGMKCTVEGVETNEQLVMLAGENCQAQGNFLGLPTAGRDVGALVQRLNSHDCVVANMPRGRRRGAVLVAFSQIVEAINDVVIVTTSDFDPPGPAIVYVNPAFTRLTGYSAAEVIGRSPRILQGPRTSRRTLDAMREGLRAGREVHEKVLNYSKAGAPYWLDVRITGLLDSNGVIANFVAVERDVTLDKRRLDELEFAVDRDTLTGIPNRRAVLRMINAEIVAQR